MVAPCVCGNPRAAQRTTLHREWICRLAARATKTTNGSAFPLTGLLVLAGAIFVSVTSEFLPTGLLPDMASELHVSESRIGLLITIFAATVVVSTTPLAALTRRFSRKSLVVVVLLVIAAGALLAAVAPNYAVLVVARVIGGLAHGLFWAVVGAYSAHLVPRHQIGRAVAITSGGATAAFVLGGIILVLAVLVLRLLPAVEHRVTLSTGEIALPLGRDRSLPGVVVICLLIVVIMTGQNLYYTYIAPWLIHTAGFDKSAIALLLFLYGGAGAIGLALAGIVADRFARRGFVAATAIVLVAVLVLATMSGSAPVVIAAIVLWGVAFGGLPAMLQTRMLHAASARIRDLAAALFTTSFNLAIGGGALVGGILLDRFGLASLPFVDLAFLVAGITLSLVTDAWLTARANRAHPQREP
jgi:predicted MFS family arabinose efflux permease